VNHQNNLNEHPQRPYQPPNHGRDYSEHGNWKDIHRNNVNKKNQKPYQSPNHAPGLHDHPQNWRAPRHDQREHYDTPQCENWRHPAPPSKAAPPPARAQNQTRQQTHPCDKGQLPAQLKTSPPARTAEPAPLVGIGNQLNLPLFVTQPPKMNSHTVPPPTPLPLHHDQPAGTRSQRPDPASKTRPIHNSNQTTAPFLWETSLPWGRPPAAY
jgi:hypothetical protein